MIQSPVDSWTQPILHIAADCFYLWIVIDAYITSWIRINQSALHDCKGSIHFYIAGLHSLNVFREVVQCWSIDKFFTLHVSQKSFYNYDNYANWIWSTEKYYNFCLKRWKFMETSILEKVFSKRSLTPGNFSRLLYLYQHQEILVRIKYATPNTFFEILTLTMDTHLVEGIGVLPSAKYDHGEVS